MLVELSELLLISLLNQGTTTTTTTTTTLKQGVVIFHTQTKTALCT